jgi:hypothetical protein
MSQLRKVRQKQLILSAFLFYFALQVIRLGLPKLKIAICFALSTNSNISLIQNHPYKLRIVFD